MAKTANEKTRQAYQNAQKLREVVRGIYRACSLDPSYAGVSGPEQAAKRLARARQLTDTQLAGVDDAYHRNLMEEAIKAERIAAGQAGNSSHLHVMVQQAYELMQVLPSWEGLPEGATENKLRAVEALLKTTVPADLTAQKAIQKLEAISLIVGVKKLDAPKPKPKPQPQVTVSMGPAIGHQPAAPILEETGKPQSPHHLQTVDKSVEAAGFVWGYHAPYYMIKKGTPMTWGECLMWIDKGHKKPGKTGDKYYVHPGYATQAIKDYHAPLLATETHLPDEGSEEDGNDEAIF